MDRIRLGSTRGRGIVAATVLGSGVAFLDATVVNVALPALGRSLDASFAGLQWTVDAYLLSLSALVLVGGALGDRFGRRRVFLIGLVGFGGTSALCALAPSMASLVVFRALQGVAAALLVPGNLALLRSSFDERDQPRAIGVWAGLSGVTTAAGPLLGGWLVQAVSWRAIFLINLPLIALAIAATVTCVPEARPDSRTAVPRLDLLGALLAFAALGGTTYGLIALPQRLAIASLVAGGVAFAAFLLREARVPDPMVPLGIFRSRQFTGANLATFALYFALGGTTFLLVLLLQRVLGYSPLAAGAALTPVTLLLLVLSPLMGRLVPRLGLRLPMTLGPVIAAGGLLLLAESPEGTSYLADVLPGVALLGVGLGLTVAPLTSAVLSGVETSRAGIASGVNNAIARTAGLLAVALLPLLGTISASAGSLARGFPLAMWVSAGLCVVAAGVAWLTVSGREAA